jgi:biopolymer transport protein ExbD
LPFGAIFNFVTPLGFADLGIVAIGLIVLWTGYRKSERWAWLIMLIVLLAFYFPTCVLPVFLQIRAGNYRWSYLLGLFGIFWVPGWWHCWIASLRPYSAIGMACFFVSPLIGLQKFLVMFVALLLPIKAFFLKPPQTEARTKIATRWKKHASVWALALLLVVAFAIAFMTRSLIPSSQDSAARNWLQIRETFQPYPMVFVDLARAENTVFMTDAGMQDSVVVAVTRDGATFLGANKVDPAQLSSRIRANRAGRTRETMYLRADRRARYRGVENDIEAMRSAGANVVGLLTKRKEDAQPENFIWIGNPLLKSVGLEISFPSPPKTLGRGLNPSDSAVVVQVIVRPDATPAYKINAADVAHADLGSRLSEIFADRAERVMFIKGDDNLNFSDIVDVIDIGRAANIDHIGLMTLGVIAGN